MKFSEESEKYDENLYSSSRDVSSKDIDNNLASSEYSSSITSSVKEEPDSSEYTSNDHFDRPTPPSSGTTKESEITPGCDDKPVKEKDDDFLGSSDFATYLAKRIVQIYYGNTDSANTKQFVMIQVYGAWGSGKTSFLNFLENALSGGENSKKNSSASIRDFFEKILSGETNSQKVTWSIVKFNAWREQHRMPPWWALMDTIFQDNKKNMKFHHRIFEYISRMKSEKVSYFLTIMITLLIIAAISYLTLYFSSPSPAASSPVNASASLIDTVAEQAKSITTILALLTGLGGVVLIGVRSFIFGSAQAVLSSEDLTAAQREKVKGHFKRLIDNIDANVAIFIDDLDRCKAEYVVELLEGIQTLLKDEPVAVVVAADRRWLHESYHEVYSGFSDAVKEPGRPMEYLFLEKAFQMSVPMPELSDDQQKKYMKYLLKSSNKAKEKQEIEDARKKAKEILEGIKTEDEIRTVISAQKNLTVIEKRILMLEAMILRADIVPLEHVEHRLQKFAPLLEPNPRAMKRFVNDWEINMNIASWMEMNINTDQLALWTILMRRWPSCAHYLYNHPEKIREFSITGITPKQDSNQQDSNQKDSRRDSGCYELFTNKEIRQVVTGQIEGLTVEINEDVIEKCRFLCAS